jgi:peroxiredoxin
VQKAFADQEGYEFPVLADYWPHGEVARRYGVFDDALGCATRATFLVNAKGTIVDRFGTDELRTPREPERYDEALTRL